MKNTEDNRGNIELYNPMTTRMNNDPNVTKKTRIQTSPKGTIAKIGIGNDSLWYCTYIDGDYVGGNNARKEKLKTYASTYVREMNALVWVLNEANTYAKGMFVFSTVLQHRKKPEMRFGCVRSA